MSNKKFKIGFTQGTFDMFHVGHLNLLLNAREQCEYLIVGVNSDQLVREYKNKFPVIPAEDRMKIISNIKGVDRVVLTTTLDKVYAWNKYRFNAIFIGDDWKGDSRWEQTVINLSAFGVEVVFLPHTPSVSSSALRPVSRNAVAE